MAEELKGVYIKPIVRQEMDNYVDGYGNKRDWKAYNKTLPVTKFVSQPNPFQESLTFRALVTSEEPRDPRNSIGAVRNVRRRDGTVRPAVSRPSPKRFIQYLVTIRFNGIKFSDEEKGTAPLKWEVAGATKFSRVPTVENNTVMLKCQCRDFMFTFERPLALNGGLWPNNRWTRYERLTPKGSGYPERNPKEKMGYCKHIATMLNYLWNEGMVRNR